MSTSRMSPLRRRIMEALDKHPGGPVGPIGIPEGTHHFVATVMNRLEAEGLAVPNRNRLTDAGRAALEKDRARERRQRER